jgi:murein DD-endopeptidase MepM/ murein hydrolase activator NlpD
VKRTLSAFAVVGLLAALQVAGVRATDPSPCPSPSASPGAASGARESTASGVRPSPSPCPTPDPTQQLYAQLEARLGGDIAKALAAQERLSNALDRVAVNEQALSDQVSQLEQQIADLEDQIAQLDGQIQDTQDRIATEKTQVATMARAIYRQPHSFIDVVARAGSLQEALTMTADLVVAGQRAHALQTKLEADLAKLAADRKARLADLDRQNSYHDRLVATLSSLDDLMALQADLSSQLDDLMSQIQDALSGLRDLPPDVTSALANLLETQEADLVQKSDQAAWAQAQVGAGLAMALGELPEGRLVGGLTLSWPIAGARITQPFGPSNVLLEPPLGPYPHFHTGIDLAAPLGTPVTAAATGVVVAVAHTNIGYGNYVIIAHGGGIMTLYGHLLETDAKVGQKVVRGQLIGLEGSSGLSTGPHVHFELRKNNQVVDPINYMPDANTAINSTT